MLYNVFGSVQWWVCKAPCHFISWRKCA